MHNPLNYSQHVFSHSLRPQNIFDTTTYHTAIALGIM